MKRYALPDLPYDYSALEPHISGRIMELHHDKHHRAYVKGANEAQAALAEAREKKRLDRVAAFERSLAFNLSGHVLHSLFWRNLSPEGGGEPTGDLAAAITADFGGFAALKAQLVQAAGTIMGSGWAILAWEPVSRRLVSLQVHDHQSDTAQGAVPLMVIDAWEHAYYLQYQTEKTRYFDALWNLWSWADVAGRFARAQALDLGLRGAVEDEAGAPRKLAATG